MVTIQSFLKKINASCVVQSYIPMDLGMGFPMLNIAGDRLIVSVFYYRSVLRPGDQSLLMPPEYGLSFDYPSGRLLTFDTLRLNPRYANVNFENPLGTFRHEAIQDLDQNGYKAKKEGLYNLLNQLLAFLGEEGEYTARDEENLSQLYSRMTEPPLHPFYQALAPQFFKRFIRK